ncbi:MAG TPA: hypothetical protein VJA66_01005 [Thermoanaerobaculia bacterium]
MAKMAKISTADRTISMEEMKKAILAVEAERLKHPPKFRPDRAQRAALLKGRKDAEKSVSAFLGKAGMDLKKFKALQEKRSAELERMVARHKAEAIKLASQQKDTLYSSITAQAAALKDVAAKTGFFPYPTFTLDTPFLIWTIPLTDLSDSAAVPFGSFAKFNFKTSQNITQKVGFYFFWPNPYQDYAVINAATFFSATGHLTAHAPWTFWSNSSEVYAYADFNLWLGWPTGVTSSNYAIEFLGSTGALGGGVIGGDTNGTNVSGGFSLNTTMFAVPPNTVVVFEVAIELDCSVDDSDGYVEADFESGAFQIACPVVVFSLLNMPPGSVA